MVFNSTNVSVHKFFIHINVVAQQIGRSKWIILAAMNVYIPFLWEEVAMATLSSYPSLSFFQENYNLFSDLRVCLIWAPRSQ